jgi:hypothetical protein
VATIKLKIFVAELTNVMSLYDSIQVQRSTTAPPSTTPVDLTEDTAQPAVLIGTQEGPYIINGQTFQIKVNGTQVDVTFTAPDPVALPDVVDELNAAFTLASLAATASDDGTGKPKIVTNDSGTHYTLEIIGGTALVELGFSVGDKDNGEAEHITLAVGTTEYLFDDGSGLASYYYRTRFFNTLDQVFSGWSDWILGETGAAVDSAELIVGKVKLAGLDGVALVNHKIVIVNVFDQVVKDEYGIFGPSVILETDGTGYAETTLVKGSLVDVIFSGTSIVRRILVPSTGTEFDLLDDSLVVDDQLEIKRPDLPYAPRRS